MNLSRKRSPQADPSGSTETSSRTASYSQSSIWPLSYAACTDIQTAQYIIV